MLALTITHDYDAGTRGQPHRQALRRPGVTSPSPFSSDAVVIGIDYGTLSGRAVVVRVSDGQELGSAVHEYSHAVLDSALPTGEPLPPEWALQVPADYIAVLRLAVPEALRASGVDPADVIGIGTDFTACTMVATLADGTPLCEVPAFSTSPHAFVKLWRHHAAQPQADRINDLARERGETWLARYGGLISSEWEFAKGLQMLEEAPELYAAMDHFVEAADWIVWQLTGAYVRNACTAGYKGLYQGGAYPDEAFLSSLNPGFASFVSDKLEHAIGQLGDRAGSLSAEAAAWTGLPAGIAVAVGNVDAHVTAPAAQAVEPGQMVAIMGTSTCHVMNGAELHEVPGMCGVVDGGIVAGQWGYEAGQSGVGDIFGWFVKHGVPPEYHERAAATGVSVHELLTELARGQAIGEHGLIALDWHSGNRSVLVDHELSGVVVGQTLATRAEDTYRALLEATAFGTRTIIEAFNGSGVPVTELVVAGGLLRNTLLMQIYADVTNLPLSTITSAQGPALGSAIHAAVAAGAYPDVHTAALTMGRSDKAVYQPIAANVKAYEELFADYTELHDHFGRGATDVMHRLKARKRELASDSPSPSSPVPSWLEPSSLEPLSPGLLLPEPSQPKEAGMTSAAPVGVPAEARKAVDELRLIVADLHRELTRYGLVVWTAGNVSARVPGHDLMVIKPSGVAYDELTAANMVVTDLFGMLVEGDHAPSSDTAAHAYVYRHLPDVGGVVHTHSTYATAWAALGEPIPCVLTMMADEFGGDVPIGPFALIGDDSIGRGIVDTLRDSRSPAVLMAGHGPFTIGMDARAAVKAAVMVEEVARTVHLAFQSGTPKTIAAKDIDSLHARYQNVYGQTQGATS
jgi:L-ribulokinase